LMATPPNHPCHSPRVARTPITEVTIIVWMVGAVKARGEGPPLPSPEDPSRPWCRTNGMVKSVRNTNQMSRQTSTRP